MPNPPSDAPTRLLVGRYELREVLGRGGMATVWSAFDQRLGRTVAVKLLRDDLPPDQTIRIELEGRAAARIDDPRVVTVLDLDRTPDGVPFLVLQAHDGRTLADDLRAGALPAARVEQLAADIGGALAAAHAEGVLHRDLKPANILSDPDGFRLTDFGIASVDDVETSGDLVGTLAYMAPERFDGAPASTRSDVFGLGVVLHEALTGRQPYRGATQAETLQRLRSGTLDPLPADTPAALAATIRSSIAADPAQRPPDGRAFVEALQADPWSPTVAISLEDATERLDRTEVLRPGRVDPSPSAPSAPHPGPSVGRAGATWVDGGWARLRPAAERAWATAGTSVRAGARWFRGLADHNPPAAIAMVAAVVVALVVLVGATTSVGDRTGGDGDVPSTPTGPAAQIDADLARIEEIGR